MDITIGIITVSDRSFQGEREDRGGPLLIRLAGERLGTVTHSTIVPDEVDIIRGALLNCIDNLGVDIVLTTGGTGISSRDVTPEATKTVIEREMPGIGEIIRVKGFEHTQMSVLSRALAGVRGKAIIVNFPGSPKAIEQSFDLVVPALKHGIEILRGESSE